jgi:hypothetical protein
MSCHGMPQWAEQNNLCLRCKRLPELRCGFEGARITDGHTGYTVTIRCPGFQPRGAVPGEG